MTERIVVAQSDDEIENCYAVMAELRPHLSSDEFLRQVKRQAATSDYRLIYLSDDSKEVKAVAGFRIYEWLATGKYLCIEDLSTKSGEQSRGFGGSLFDWLVEHAWKNECTQIQLVSRVTRFDAHHFYLRKRMNIEAHYFSLDL